MKTLSLFSLNSPSLFLYKESPLKISDFEGKNEVFEKGKEFKNEKKGTRRKIINERLEAFHKEHGESSKEELKEFIIQSAQKDINSKLSLQELEFSISQFEEALKNKPEKSQEKIKTQSENSTNIETNTKTIINGKDRFKASDCVEGKTFNTLDFPNDYVERAVGLADLMPFSVRSVLLTLPDGTSQKAVRKTLGGNFYTPSNNYAKVFDGYTVSIEETTSPEKVEALRNTAEEAFPTENIDQADHNEKEKQILQEIGIQYGIDPLLLLALRKTENGDTGREMGILSVKTNDFTDQVRLAARSIENSSYRFEKKYPDHSFWESFGKISAEGLAFCSSRYCTDETEHAQLWAKMYRKNGGSRLRISNSIQSTFIDDSARRLDEYEKNPEILSDQLTKEEALKRLGSNFFLSSTADDFDNRNNPKATTLEGIRTRTIDGIKALQSRLNRPFKITGGTETGHAGGLRPSGITHGNGFKVDISFENGVRKDLVKLIRSKDKRPVRIKGYGKQYTFTEDGYTYKVIYEKDHFDIAVL